MIKKLDFYMSCGVNEYWIVNPLNKEITVYLLKKKTLKINNEMVLSFIFEGLSADLKRIFR